MTIGNRNLVVDLSKKHRPWGYYEDISRMDDTVYKEIVVNPGARLSLQYHNERNEFWYIAEGVGIVTIGDDDINVSKGDHVFIGKTIPHRVKNIGEGLLRIREMQCGICREDDIVRIEDDYGRVDVS